MASSTLRSLHDSSVPFSRPSTPAIPLRLGFIGIGAMGYMMSRNLATKNHYKPGNPPLLVWNRTISKSEQLLSEIGESKVAIAQSVEQVVSDCDIIFTNLATDEVVKSIYDQIAKALSVRCMLGISENYADCFIGSSSKQKEDLRGMQHCMLSSKLPLSP